MKRPRIARTLRVPLFNYKVLKTERDRVVFAPTPEQLAKAADYSRKVSDPKFLKQKETAVRGLFIQDVLQTVLGYTPFDPASPYTLAIEQQIRSGAVDVALGRFSGTASSKDIAAPFELKGPDTHDLDQIVPGRGRSPVQQAWDYAIDAPGSKWVLVSNCVEVRLYGFGRGRDAYEMFDLSRLDEREELARLWLLLSAERFHGPALRLACRIPRGIRARRFRRGHRQPALRADGISEGVQALSGKDLHRGRRQGGSSAPAPAKICAHFSAIAWASKAWWISATSRFSRA